MVTPGHAEAIGEAVEGAAGFVVILSANPLHDTGGGQRSAQLALEFLSRDFAVVFVSHGRVTETTDLGLEYEQSRLVELDLREVDSALQEVLATPASVGPSLLITQVPVASWLPVVQACGEAGFITIYDCVDPWDSELGRGWYRREDEASISRASDVLVASAPTLGEHVERLAGRETTVLPNAFNSKVFHPGAGATRPSDLPEGSRIALYVGALWYRMDWGLVGAAAAAHEDVQFVFVGDHRREGRGLPGNCHFLGLKPQADLPGYLAAADVAFLPWNANDVTQATSPLKVYEFMAMGLPVVAPELEPLRGIDGVRLCATPSDFVAAFDSVGRHNLDDFVAESMRRFSEENSWVSRVDSMLDLVARSAEEKRVEAPAVVTRPTGSTVSVVIPAYNHERYIGAAIDSVRDQTLPASELVIVDDGSSDGTPEVIAAHAFPGMRVVSQENRGAHRAINRAISLSSGDYVAILNSDDVYEPHWLEHAWGVARASQAALVCGSVRLIDEQGGAVDPEHDIARWYPEARAFAQSRATLAAALRHHNVVVTTSNFFMHKELWARLGGFSAYRYVHDYDFLLRAVELCGRDACYEDSLQGIRYRIHGANTISEGPTKGGDAEHIAMKDKLARPGGRLSRLVKRGPARAAVRAAVASAGSRAPVTESDLVRSSSDAVTADRTMSTTASGPHHVGIVVESLGTGGLEEIVALLAQTLPSLGTAASVLCTREGGAIADRLEAAGVPVHVAGRQGDLGDWVRSQGVSVLSSHFVALDSLEELASTGVPIVETIQNTYAWFAESDWEIERRKLDVLHATIAVSDTVANYYHRHTGHRPRWVVPNAVHPGRAASVPRAFARRTLDVPETTPLFLSVGRITVQKNPLGLLRAFERVVAEYSDAVLLLVGPTDRSVPISELRSLHRSLFSADSVRHVSTVPDVGRVLSAADAFVSNSFYEGWSVAASEAAWTGLPVVLSETGGAVELVGPDSARGVVVPNPCGDPLEVGQDPIARPPETAAAENESALAAALIGMARDRVHWEAKRDEILRHARTTLAPVAIGRRYLEALGEAVAESSP